MVPLLTDRTAEIADLCRRFHVRRLDVFGSAARENDFTDQSDIDLLVEYEADHGGPNLNEFFGLREALADLLGREVDLVMAGALRNPYLIASIERFRQPVHGA